MNVYRRIEKIITKTDEKMAILACGHVLDLRVHITEGIIDHTGDLVPCPRCEELEVRLLQR